MQKIFVDNDELNVESGVITPERIKIECTGVVTFYIIDGVTVTLGIKTVDNVRQVAVIFSLGSESSYEIKFPDYIDIPEGIIFETLLSNLARHSLDTIIRVVLAKSTILKLYLSESGKKLTFELTTLEDILFARTSINIMEHNLLPYLGFEGLKFVI